jgi:hypothetical protein
MGPECFAPFFLPVHLQCMNSFQSQKLKMGEKFFGRRI